MAFRLRRVLVGLVLVFVLTIAGQHYLFVPPEGGGSPPYHPFRLEPDVEVAAYEVVATHREQCRNDTTSYAFQGVEHAWVNRTVGSRRYVHRVRSDGVEGGDLTFRHDSYATANATYHRTISNGNVSYRRESSIAHLQRDIQRYEPIFPQILRFEWRLVGNGSTLTYRPRSGYWSEWIPPYQWTDRVFIADAAGTLTTTQNGALLTMNVTGTFIRANTRFERYAGDPLRCTFRLTYRYRPGPAQVDEPRWVGRRFARLTPAYLPHAAHRSNPRGRPRPARARWRW